MDEDERIACGSCNEQIELPGSFCPSCGNPLSKSQQKYPGEEYLNKALKQELAENSVDAAMSARRALELGLAERDEILARTVLGLAVITQFGQDTSESGSEQLDEGISEMERAISLDAKGKHGFFDDPTNVSAWIPKLELAYSLKGNLVRENHGIENAIAYLKDRLKLFGHRSENYFILLNFTIGTLCHEKGDNTEAEAYWLRAANAKPFSDESEFESSTKQKALNNLQILREGSTHSASAQGSDTNKSFTGSWKVVAVLGGLTIISLFMIKDLPGPGFVNLLIWGGILALYWWRKYK